MTQKATKESEAMEYLSYWLTESTADIFAHFGSIGKGDKEHTFIDNGADVLAVAHLDTVQRLSGLKYRKGNKIWAHGLDDRLGAFTIFHLLPYKIDILLTNYEEDGASTAQYFEFPEGKEYRYCMQFDRSGNDVVTYNRDSLDFLSDLVSLGAEIGTGSFTDLCYLNTDACCVNFGTAYYDAHGKKSWADLDDLADMVRLSTELFHLGKSYKQDSPTRAKKAWKSQYRGFGFHDNPMVDDTDHFTVSSDYSPIWDNIAFFCCMCGEKETLEFDFPVCAKCEDTYVL
jgi:hypothetical protein